MIHSENLSDQFQNIEQLSESMVKKRPEMEVLIKPFSLLFKEKALLMEELKETPFRIRLSYASLLSGAPLLSGVKLDPLRKPLENAFQTMLGAINKAFPDLSGPIAKLSEAFENQTIDIVLLTEQYLNGSFTDSDASEESMTVLPGTLNLVLKFSLSTVLEVLVMKADLDSDTLSWKKGYCPVCGFPPSISCLAKASDAQSEFLKGGGGQKYLHCSLCGNNWRVKRHMCPVCENEEPKDLLYFQAEGAVGERVDVCRKCGFYLPCIDLREFSSDIHLDISAVSMVHLDIKAQGKGFKPVTPLPWNTFD